VTFTKPVIVTTADAITCDGPVVLKAQVPFGGRGKAGAVKFANTTAEARQAAAELLRMELRGVNVASVSVEPKLTFTRELYVGIAWDTLAKLPVALLSVTGGVDIESSRQVARRTFD